MEPEKINLIFSIFFLIWCLPVIGLYWDKEIVKSDYNEYMIGLGIGLLSTTFFNILAYYCKKCWFYFIGAFGFLLFFVLHFVSILVFIIFIQPRFVDYIPAEYKFFTTSSFNFPLSAFALTSTLYCHRKMYHQEIDKNYHTTSSSKPMLINFCPSDLIKCIKIYNYSILFTTAVFIAYALRIDTTARHGCKCYDVYLTCLLPILISISSFLAIKFDSKKLCIFIITSLTLFSIFVVSITGMAFHDKARYGLSYYDLIIASSILSTYFINVFICIATTLFIYQSIKNELKENKSKNQQNVQIIIIYVNQ